MPGIRTAARGWDPGAGAGAVQSAAECGFKLLELLKHHDTTIKFWLENCRDWQARLACQTKMEEASEPV